MIDFQRSQEQAGIRLARVSTRRRRADAGRSRLPARIIAEIGRAASGVGRPSMARLQRRLADLCAREGWRTPSRASLYNALPRLTPHVHDVASLPPSVRRALYNLAPDGRVPGHQLVFYCLNFGSLDAIGFAAGLPWLDLYQAQQVRGWRPRSRGLLAAILRTRDRA